MLASYDINALIYASLLSNIDIIRITGFASCRFLFLLALLCISYYISGCFEM